MLDTKRKDPKEGILETIDFFSQVLHPEQLEEYGFYYIHELLGFSASAIYMVRGRTLKLVKSLNWQDLPEVFAMTEEHEALATKVGVVLYSDLERYIGHSESVSQASFLLPLMHGEVLIGMILAADWAPLNEEDVVYVEAVKKLINLAFYTGIQMTENRSYKQFMDRKFYDQMLLQQLTRLLLQNLDENQLIQSAVDGVRELTASAITSFFLKDELTNRLVLRHHSDLLTFRKSVAEISPIANQMAYRLRYNLLTDQEVLTELFGTDGYEVLHRLGAKQLIMLSVGEIQGFVTVSDSVTGAACDQTVLELVESIMGTVLIGLENARHYHQLKQQKHELTESLSAMNAMAKSLHTLSSATDVVELAELTLMQMSLHLGLRASAFCIRKGEAYELIAHQGLSEMERDALKVQTLTEAGRNMVQTGWVTNYGTEDFEKYARTPNDAAETLFMGRQMLLLAIRDQSIAEEEAPLAIIWGFDFEQAFKQYERHFTEVLLHGVVPIFKQLMGCREQQMTHTASPEDMLVQKLENYEAERQKYWIDFNVQYRKSGFKLFKNPLSIQSGLQIGPYEFFVVQEGAEAPEAITGFIEGSLEEIFTAIEQLLNE